VLPPRGKLELRETMGREEGPASPGEEEESRDTVEPGLPALQVPLGRRLDSI
jgi:hypothetical protein